MEACYAMFDCRMAHDCVNMFTFIADDCQYIRCLPFTYLPLRVKGCWWREVFRWSMIVLCAYLWSVSRFICLVVMFYLYTCLQIRTKRIEMLTLFQVCGSPCQFVAKSSLLPLPWYLTQIPSATKTNMQCSQNNILLRPILSGWRQLELEVQKKRGCRFQQGHGIPMFPPLASKAKTNIAPPSREEQEVKLVEPASWRKTSLELMAPPFLGGHGGHGCHGRWVVLHDPTGDLAGESWSSGGPGNGRSSSDFPGLHCQVRHVCLPQNDKNNATQSARLHGCCCQASSRSDSSGSWSLPLPSEAPSQQLHGTPNKALFRVLLPYYGLIKIKTLLLGGYQATIGRHP